MKVLSVNVGQPREIEWRGQMIRTSVFKTPVTGRVRIRPLNFDGDAQADLKSHGGEHKLVACLYKNPGDYSGLYEKYFIHAIRSSINK